VNAEIFVPGPDYQGQANFPSPERPTVASDCQSTDARMDGYISTGAHATTAIEDAATENANTEGLRKVRRQSKERDRRTAQGYRLGILQRLRNDCKELIPFTCGSELVRS